MMARVVFDIVKEGLPKGVGRATRVLKERTKRSEREGEEQSSGGRGVSNAVHAGVLRSTSWCSVEQCREGELSQEIS